MIGTEPGPWTNEEYVPNMLKTKWGQSNPYNIRVPNGTDPTGCTPVAIAQLLTYNKFYYNRAPDVISSATIQWDLIKQAVQTPSLLKATPYNDPTISVAWLIRLIGRAGGTDYGASGSSTKKYKAVNLMEQWYRNVYREDVSETYVRRMIFERRLPAIIMGRNTNGDGHSWVADGWLYRTRIVYSIYNDGSKKKYMTQGQRLVHCNFGWEGSHDGYYYVGAFNTAKSPVTLGVSSTGPNDFSNDNEIMMYML